MAVVVWGAYVRASGSGAGCGDHWPLCNGELVPLASQAGTLIELAHRATSGLALLLVVGLFIGVSHAFSAGHLARKSAGLAMFSIIVESALGALIVLANFTGNNTSTMRALVVALHLVNTLILLGAIVLTTWWAGGGKSWQWRQHPAQTALFAGGAIGFALLGSSGAVAALGDTLFPATSVAQGLQVDLSLAVSLLIRLRVLHPLFAVFMGVFACAMALFLARRAGSRRTRNLAWIHLGLFCVQCGLGLLNIALLAPIPLQLAHLLLADCVWIAYIWLVASALAEPNTALILDVTRVQTVRAT